MIESSSFLDRFMPHGVCYQWRPDILWLNVLSDLTIAFAYMLIPIALLFYMRRRSAASFTSIVYLFSIFIASCGVTHFFGVFTVWNGLYGIHGLLKAFTAATSVATVVMLIPFMPKILAVKTEKEMELANSLLRQQIEQRKDSERHTLKLQNELARVGRITTVGQMATGLAHELNQPLLAISASADTAAQAARVTPVNNTLLFECLEDVQKDTQRANEIIRTLRNFVSKKSPTMTEVDVNNLIDEAVQLVSGEARNANVDIVIKTGVIPSVSAVSVQISQVLVNLLRNAIEAIASPKQSDREQNLITVTSRCDHDNVVVSVADTGPGIIDPNDLFIPFESQKPEGMGVGLSISREILQAHDGVLRYTTDKASGTTFTFGLPVVHQ